MPKESVSCSFRLCSGPPCVLAHEEELSSGFWMVSSNKIKLSTLRVEGGGVSSCCFHSMWSTKKQNKNNNTMWLCRFCTCRLPICACLSPFLHVRPFSDVLLNTNSIYVKVMWQKSSFQCISDDTFNVCAFLNTKESWLLRSKKIKVRGNGPK